MMKTTKVIYWITTILTTIMMTFSGIMQLSQQPQMLEALNNLGYPGYISIILGTGKLLGALALVFPGFPKIREWAYAGFSFLFIGATFSHFYIGDYQPTTIILLGILIISYLLGNKIKQSKSLSIA